MISTPRILPLGNKENRSPARNTPASNKYFSPLEHQKQTPASSVPPAHSASSTAATATSKIDAAADAPLVDTRYSQRGGADSHSRHMEAWEAQLEKWKVALERKGKQMEETKTAIVAQSAQNEVEKKVWIEIHFVFCSLSCAQSHIFTFLGSRARRSSPPSRRSSKTSAPSGGESAKKKQIFCKSSGTRCNGNKAS
jgi:hypothetical protein